MRAISCLMFLMHERVYSKTLAGNWIYQHNFNNSSLPSKTGRPHQLLMSRFKCIGKRNVTFVQFKARGQLFFMLMTGTSAEARHLAYLSLIFHWLYDHWSPPLNRYLDAQYQPFFGMLSLFIRASEVAPLKFFRCQPP